MKTTLFRLMWLATLCWLLAGCASMHYNTYNQAEDKKNGLTEFVFTNTSDTTFWLAAKPNNLESLPKEFWKVGRGTRVHKFLPTKEKVTFIIRYFNERGLQMKPLDVILTRESLQSGIHEITIDNAKLYGRVSESWIVHNVTNQTIAVTNDKNKQLLILAPDEDKELFDLLSDETVTFYWEAVNHPRRDKLRGQYTPKPNKLSYYNGHWYGAVITIESY